MQLELNNEVLQRWPCVLLDPSSSPTGASTGRTAQVASSPTLLNNKARKERVAAVRMRSGIRGVVLC